MHDYSYFVGLGVLHIFVVIFSAYGRPA